MHFTATILSALLLVACVTGPNTASGRPELLVPNQTVDEVRARLVGDLSADGWTVERESGSVVTFVRENDDIGLSLLAGSTYDPTVWTRLTYTLISQGDAVQIRGRCDFVSNYGSAFEKVSNVSDGKAGVQMQDRLVKQFPTGTYRRGIN